MASKKESVALVTYKPGWKFSATEEHLVIEHDVADSRGGQPMHLTFRFPWDEGWKHYTVDYVWDCIRRAEMHEMAEWFRVDGVMTHDPHTTTTEEFNFTDKRLA